MKKGFLRQEIAFLRGWGGTNTAELIGGKLGTWTGGSKFQK